MITKRLFKLTDIDCAHCAAKIEKNIRRINGVVNADVVFLTQTVTIEANDEDFERIINEAAKIVKKIEPDCELVCK